MKRQMILAVLLMVLGLESQACESCGCSVSSGGLGLLSQVRANYIGVRWQHASFRGTQRGLQDNDHYTQDHFNRVEIRGRYFLTKRLHLNAVLPYIYNDRNSFSAPVKIKGIGDPSILLNANLIDRKAGDDQLFSHFLSVGAGLKLPLGSYNANQKDDIPDNFNTGSGSVDFQLQLNYNLSFRDFGLSTSMSRQMNTRNKDDYKFGNQLALSSVLFWQQMVEEISVLSYAGLYIERIDEDELRPDFKQHGSGGKGMFATFGAEIYIDRFSFNAYYQAPLSNNYSSDEVLAQNRISLGINLLL